MTCQPRCRRPPSHSVSVDVVEASQRVADHLLVLLLVTNKHFVPSSSSLKVKAQLKTLVTVCLRANKAKRVHFLSS